MEIYCEDCKVIYHISLWQFITKSKGCEICGDKKHRLPTFEEAKHYLLTGKIGK